MTISARRAIAQFLASTSDLTSKLATPIALLAIRAGIEDFGDLEDWWH